MQRHGGKLIFSTPDHHVQLVRRLRYMPFVASRMEPRIFRLTLLVRRMDRVALMQMQAVGKMAGNEKSRARRASRVTTQTNIKSRPSSSAELVVRLWREAGWQPGSQNFGDDTSLTVPSAMDVEDLGSDQEFRLISSHLISSHHQ